MSQDPDPLNEKQTPAGGFVLTTVPDKYKLLGWDVMLCLLMGACMYLGCFVAKNKLGCAVVVGAVAVGVAAWLVVNHQLITGY